MTKPFRLVGTAILPEQSDVGLDEGAFVTFHGLQALAGTGPQIPRNIYLVKFRPGVDKPKAIAAIDDKIELYIVPIQRPSDLVNFGRVDRLPGIGAGVVAVAAAAMLAHVLLTSLRRRRRDLAVLRTLGFTSGQLSQAVAWQASTLALVALLLGLPLGIAAGRWAWTLLARHLGVIAVPEIPLLLVALAIPGTLLIANLVAAVPARLAGRVRPALILRAE